MTDKLKTYFAENKYRIALLAILAAALLIRVYTMLGPLAFDEIWTLENYIGSTPGRMLTDLATPNNHPLNSLFMKLWLNLFGGDVQLLRLHSLVFGMLSVVLTGVLARGIFHSRVTAYLSMVFIAFDAAAVNYSGLARGYMTQLFFLLLFTCGIVYGGRLRRFLPRKYLPEAAIVLGAFGAVLSVPSAPIFLAAVVIAARIYRRKEPEVSVLIALGISGALVAGYLGLNQAALREAQANFGTRFNSLNEWFGFLLMLLQDFCALAVAPFLIVLAATDRKRGLLLLLCAAAIVVSPALTSAGPSRVYLPLCVPVAMGAGRGANALLTVALCRNNRRLFRLLLLATVFLALFGCYQLYGNWSTPDYWKWLESGLAMPPKYLVVYPATATYPLKWNNDEKKIARDQAERLAWNGSGSRRMLCFGAAPGTVNGMNAARGEEVRKTGVNGTPGAHGGFPAVEYELYPTEALKPGETFVAILASGEMAASLNGAGCELLRLDPHFPGLLVFGKAPGQAMPLAGMLDAGAKFYTFTSPQAAAKP